MARGLSALIRRQLVNMEVWGRITRRSAPGNTRRPREPQRALCPYAAPDIVESIFDTSSLIRAKTAATNTYPDLDLRWCKLAPEAGSEIESQLKSHTLSTIRARWKPQHHHPKPLRRHIRKLYVDA